jgi:multidrug efflux pump
VLSVLFVFLVLAAQYESWSGAKMRIALGTAVFFGMLGVTLFGLFLTPVLYVTVRSIVGLEKAIQPHRSG